MSPFFSTFNERIVQTPTPLFYPKLENMVMRDWRVFTPFPRSMATTPQEMRKMQKTQKTMRKTLKIQKKGVRFQWFSAFSAFSAWMDCVFRVFRIFRIMTGMVTMDAVPLMGLYPLLLSFQIKVENTL